MVTPSDRLRRILSDAAPSAPTPQPPSAPQPTGRGSPEGETPPRSDRARRIRDRLDALGVGRLATPTAPDGSDEGAATWEGVDDDRPLEEQVGGRVRETPHGGFLYLERRVPLSQRHGGEVLEASVRHGIRLRAHEAGPRRLARLEPTQAVFLDTETTGLSGGTGTVAFLVGTGRVEGDDLVVRQYCMRDYPEETALLHALVEDLGDQPLVTFNGRSFDWPLLTTRLSLHRLQAGPRAHLDLLHLARRLWVDTVPSHTLSALEEHVLGLTRENDLPGWRIPQAYFDYLRTGKPGLIALAFKHNEIDVVSMLSLMGKIGGILAAPAERPSASARDLHGTARLLLDLDDAPRAKSCLELGIGRAPTQEAVPLRRHLGHILRREGRYDEALAEWSTLAKTAPSFDIESFEQVAKLFEHRRRDYESALTWVEEALLHVTAGSRAEEAFRHREKRLRRRLESTKKP